MPPVGFELTTSAGERPQTYALDFLTDTRTKSVSVVCITCLCTKLGPVHRSCLLLGGVGELLTDVKHFDISLVKWRHHEGDVYICLFFTTT